MQESFKENPFYPDLSNVLKTEMVGVEKRVADLMGVDPETGQILDEELTEIREVIWRLTHKTRFLKLMSDSVHKLMELNTAGNKMFWLLAGSVSVEGHNKDYIYLGLDHCQSMASSAGHTLSKTTYYKGIENLCNSHIIAKSKRSGIFWLNISILFNGNFSALPKLKERDTIRKKLADEGRQVTWVEKKAGT